MVGVQGVGFRAHHSGSGPRIKYGTGSAGIRDGMEGADGQVPDFRRATGWQSKGGLEGISEMVLLTLNQTRKFCQCRGEGRI